MTDVGVATFQSWDDTLASLAGVNTLQCKMNHDECRNTVEYPMVGQNIAENTDKTGVEMVKWAPGYWFEEWAIAQPSDITEYTRLENENG